MIKRIDECNNKRVDEFLDGSLTAEESREFESHLTDCQDCRELLEEHSAEPEVWDNARALLGTSEQSFASQNCEDSEDSDLVASVQPGLGVLDSLAPTDDPEMLGRLGVYEIGGIVGVGGMGAVLRGFDKSLRRVVAIKVMAPHLAGSGPARTRFQREARAAAAITHDNVIDIYGVSEANGLPYLVMPFARGPSLQKRIDESGPLSVVEIARIGKQIASGLAAAHEQGLVHRDIKPANILLNEGVERLWITDFGVARAMDDASMTKTGVIAGTPQYMSPEQARGESVDQRSDLFSLGSILYTACTGRPPFRSEAAYGVLRRITDTDPRPIREINSYIPEWMERMINRLMAKHPADRFQNASEVADLLENCIAHIQQPTMVDLPPSLASAEFSLTESSVRVPAPQPEEVPRPPLFSNSFSMRKFGGYAMLSLLICFATGLVAFEVTEPQELEGTWQGDVWQNVNFSSTPEARGWYSGTFEDGDGEQGVLHLEWSRLQRRYNGRWSIEQGPSGRITLRSQNGTLRGALSVDADSKVDASTPRLRDFAWEQGSGVESEFGGSTSGNGPAPSDKRYYRVRVPQKGTVARIADQLKLESKVKKGQLLASISPERDLVALDAELKTSEQNVESYQQLYAAKVGELDIAERSMEAMKTRVASYREAAKKIDEASNNEVQSSMGGVEPARRRLVQYEEALANAKQELVMSEKMASKGIVSAAELARAKQKLSDAKIQIEDGKSAIEAAELAILSKQSERQVSLKNAESRIQDAIADRNSAEANVASANTGVVEARTQLLAAKRELEVLKARTDHKELRIYSPVDGTVTAYEIGAVGQTVQRGETLLMIEISQPAKSTASATGGAGLTPN